MKNPAEKLLTILTELNGPRYNGITNRDAWKDVLGMQDKPTFELYRSMANVFALPNEISLALVSIDYPISTIEPLLTKLESLFSTLEFNVNSVNFTQHLSADVFNSLQQTKWIIDNPKLSQFTTTEIKTLNELSEQLKSLFEQISNIDDAKIVHNLKEFLDIYIAQLISGIEDYISTKNINSLKIAATSAFSVLGLEPATLESSQSNEEGIEFRKLLLEILKLIGYGNDIKQLIDNFQLLTN